MLEIGKVVRCIIPIRIIKDQVFENLGAKGKREIRDMIFSKGGSGTGQPRDPLIRNAFGYGRKPRIDYAIGVARAVVDRLDGLVLHVGEARNLRQVKMGRGWILDDAILQTVLSITLFHYAGLKF